MLKLIQEYSQNQQHSSPFTHYVLRCMQMPMLRPPSLQDRIPRRRQPKIREPHCLLSLLTESWSALREIATQSMLPFYKMHFVERASLLIEAEHDSIQRLLPIFMSDLRYGPMPKPRYFGSILLDRGEEAVAVSKLLKNEANLCSEV